MILNSKLYSFNTYSYEERYINTETAEKWLAGSAGWGKQGKVGKRLRTCYKRSSSEDLMCKGVTTADCTVGTNEICSESELLICLTQSFQAIGVSLLLNLF